MQFQNQVPNEEDQYQNHYYERNPGRPIKHFLNSNQSSDSDQSQSKHQHVISHSQNIQLRPIRILKMNSKPSHNITRATIKRIKSYAQQLTNDNKKGYVKLFWQKLNRKKASIHASRWTPNKQWVRQQIKLAKQQFKQTVIKQVLVKNVIEFLFKYQQTISIFIQHDVLKIRIQTEDKTHCQSVFHVYQLQDQMLRYMSCQVQCTEQLKHSQVEKQTLSLFTGLLKCLKCYFSNELEKGNHKKLSSLNFLYSVQNTKQRNESFFIGGLQFTCLRFFRTLFRMVFQHQQILLSNITQNITQINQQQELNLSINDFRQQIKQNLQSLNKSIATEDCIIQQEMSSQLYQRVLKNFQLQVKNLSSLNQYDSFQSLKLHLIQDAFFKSDGQEIISKTVQKYQLKVKNVKASGRLHRKRNKDKNQIQKRKKLLYFDTNILRRLELLKFYRGQIDRTRQYWIKKQIFYGLNKQDKVTVILYNYGRFYILAQQKKIVNKYKDILKQAYNCDVMSLKYEYCFQGKLDLTQENKQLIFNESLQLSNIVSNSNLRQHAEKRIVDRKNHNQQTRHYILKNTEDIQKMQSQFQPYLILSQNKQKTIGNITQTRKINVYIQSQGYFKITGVSHKKAAQKVISKIQNQINQNLPILQSQKIKRFKQNGPLLNIQLQGDSNLRHKFFQQKINQSFIKNGSTPKQFLIKELDLCKENKKLINQKNDLPGFKLKILIWNIQSLKYFEKEDKNKILSQGLQSWIRQRLQKIFQQIERHNPHFVCLQETQIFQDKRYNQRGELFQNIIKNFERNYYCSRIPQSNKQSSRFNDWRTVIFSKIPVKFYELSYLDCICFNNTMCEFNLNINGQNFRTILVSVHLKAQRQSDSKNNSMNQQKIKSENRQKRIKQLSILKKICDNFPIAILAGDFNIGQNYPENSNKFLYQFRDLDEFFLSQKKPFTHFKKNFGHERFDRILIRIKEKKISDSMIARPQQIGNFACVPFQQRYYKKSEMQKEQVSLSDHYGRYTEIMFKR